MTERQSVRRPGLWLLWFGVMAMLAAWLADTLFDGPDRSLFLPGRTTDGHHQIELACGACHTAAFGDRDAMQAACESCHLAALEAAKDDHPKSKFTDPRNADRLALLDARYCVTCHVEHRPDVTTAMGVTQPADYCQLCHHDIAEDRPSHAGMGFDTCASAGCHNFHDNRALYEDFLLRHAEAPAMRERFKRAHSPNLEEIAQSGLGYPLTDYPWQSLGREDADAPSGALDPAAIDGWLASRHAATGVNCSACHGGQAERPWQSHPGPEGCRGCHAPEVAGFLGGKHGMRLDREALGTTLTPMTPASARRTMRADAHDHELGCSSCHGAHRYDTAHAATEACLDCHADEHSLAFEHSPHAQGEDALTCATCHMPMTDTDFFDGMVSWTHAEHNQNATLQPNEKMIRPVCLRCHGLGLAIDALADRALVLRNFDRAPQTTVASIRMAVERAERIAAERAAASQTNSPTPSSEGDSP